MVRSASMGAHELQVSGSCWMVLVTTVLLSSSTKHFVATTPAEPVEQCDATGCNLNNAYAVWNDRTTCKAASVVYPTTEQEILVAVANAVRNNQKIKVTSTYGHSIPKVACPGSSSGLILSTRKYNSIVSIDTRRSTVTAQGGILLRNLVDAIATQGLALPVSPYWDGVSLAGLLSTSAHGSSLFGKGGAVHEYVIGMRLVTPGSAAEGFAKIQVLDPEDEDLNAAKVSLGVLGVISTVTLQLEPAFKRSVTFQFVNGDADLENEVLRVAQTAEFADVVWYPSMGKVVYRHDIRVSMNVSGEGKNNYVGFQPLPKEVITASKAMAEAAEFKRDRQLKCDIARGVLAVQQAAGYGFYKDGIKYSGFPVIGKQNLIMTSGGCQRSFLPGTYCTWDQRIAGFVFHDVGAALPLRNLKAFLADVKLIRAAAPRNSFCELDIYTGILIRFTTKTTGAYLATAQEDMAMLDFAWSRGTDGTTVRMDQDVFQELEQLAFDKYEAIPHWGKNRNYVFEGVGRRYANLSKFLDAKKRFDPQGLFSSAWSDGILGIKLPGAPGVSTDAPFCAIEGLCRCKTDEHCAPNQNSFCRRGRVYSEASVCSTET